jgi:hypothetical protein
VRDKIDRKTVDMVAALWKRRCEWLWENVPYEGSLNVEWIDEQIAESEAVNK